MTDPTGTPSPGAPSPAPGAASAGRTIAILSVCGFASTFAIRFIDPMTGVIARDLAADPHRVALLSSAFALPYALIQPVLGPIGDAVGKERVMKTCLFILVVTIVVGAVTSSLSALFALRVLSGAAAGGVIPLAIATIGDRVGLADRQVAISRFLLFTISGQLLGGTLAGLLAERIGWRGVFALAAVLAGSAALSVTWGLRRASAPPGSFRVGVAAERYGRILSIGRARALYAFVFVEGIAIFGVQPFIAPLLEARGAGGPTQAGLVIAAFALGGIVYTLLVRPLLRILGSYGMLVAAGALVAAAFGAMALDLAWPVEAAAMLLIGLGFYMMHNSYQTQVTEVMIDARASAVSLHAFSYFIGQAVGPVVFGTALNAVGDAGAKLACGLAMLVLGLVSAHILFGRQTRAL